MKSNIQSRLAGRTALVTGASIGSDFEKHALLQVLQQQPGTAAERPCDIERAPLPGHEIYNRLTGRTLRESPRKLDFSLVPPPTQ